MNKENKVSFIKEWREKPEAVKASTYFSTAVAQILICSLFFILAFVLCFETDCGYFASGTLIPAFAWSTMVVFVLCLASSAFFMKNEKLPDTLPGDGHLPYFVTQYLGFISVFDGLYRAKQVIDNSADSLLYFDRTYLGTGYESYRLYRTGFVIDIATAVFCFGTALYFFAMAGKSKRSEKKALLGFLPVLRALSGIAQIYFEPKIPMNSPAKLLCEFAMMATALFFLSEIRFMLDERYARPGWYFASGLVASLVNFAAGTGLLVFYFAKSEAYSSYAGLSSGTVNEFVAGCGEICLGGFFGINIFLYIIIRMFCFVRGLVKQAMAGAPSGETDSSVCTDAEEKSGAAESGDDSADTETCLAAGNEPNAEDASQDSAAEEDGNES